MDFGFTEKEEAFRQEVRTLLKEVLPPDWAETSLSWPGGFGSGVEDEERSAIAEKARKRMREKGWHVMVWPEEWAAHEWHSNVEKAIFREEMGYQAGPGVGGTEIGISAPTIFLCGTDENKTEWLPQIASGEVRFWLAYSEPNRGSDLAGVETRAVEDGDEYVINGQKIWSSGAHRATHAWLIAKTDPNAPRKHRGLSLFIVDNNTPGITIRPIINILGIHSFNEVFFDDVRIPKSCLIGEKNRGFYHLATALDFERIMLVPSGAFKRVFERVVQYAKETKHNGEPLSKDPGVRRKLAQLAIDIEIIRLFAYRTACVLDRGLVPNVEAAALHLFGNECSPRFANIAAEIMGPYALLAPGSKWAPLGGLIERGLLDGISGPIGGGTAEIQRNIIATRGLGLRRE